MYQYILILLLILPRDHSHFVHQLLPCFHWREHKTKSLSSEFCSVPIRNDYQHLAAASQIGGNLCNDLVTPVARISLILKQEKERKDFLQAIEGCCFKCPSPSPCNPNRRTTWARSPGSRDVKAKSSLRRHTIPALPQPVNSYYLLLFIHIFLAPSCISGTAFSVSSSQIK